MTVGVRKSARTGNEARATSGCKLRKLGACLFSSTLLSPTIMGSAVSKPAPPATLEVSEKQCIERASTLIEAIQLDSQPLSANGTLSLGNVDGWEAEVQANPKLQVSLIPIFSLSNCASCLQRVRGGSGTPPAASVEPLSTLRCFIHVVADISYLFASVIVSTLATDYAFPFDS